MNALGRGDDGTLRHADDLAMILTSEQERRQRRNFVRGLVC